MDRSPDDGTTPGDDAGASAPAPSSSAATSGAQILAFPTGARVRGAAPPAPPAEAAPGGRTLSVEPPPGRFVGIRRDPTTGWTELSGVELDSAAAELEALGLRRTPDGRHAGVVGRGDFRLVLATWSDLLDQGPGRRASAPAVGRREAPRASASRTARSAGGPAGVDGCPICGRRPERMVGSDLGLATDFPELVCPDCDRRARDAGGLPLPSAPAPGAAPNPVYIDGQRCWRLYRFGGWVTLLDRHGARSFADFLDRARQSRRPREPADPSPDDAGR